MCAWGDQGKGRTAVAERAVGAQGSAAVSPRLEPAGLATPLGKGPSRPAQERSLQAFRPLPPGAAGANASASRTTSLLQVTGSAAFSVPTCHNVGA